MQRFARSLLRSQAVVASVVEDGVPGDFLETGVFRGGMSFLAAKTFELLGDAARGRRVYLADSFSGLPDLTRYSSATSGTKHKLDNQERSAHRIALLNQNSLARVQESARKLFLDMSRLSFVPGYFNESLPKLLAEKGDSLRLAVLRLDGDAFASTLEAITLLYPRLSAGGFVVIDDFTDWKSCRAAIDLYRESHQITEPLTLIPHKPGEIIRGAYWRKQPTPSQALCIGRGGPQSLRIAGGYLPSRLVPLHAADEPIPNKVLDVRVDFIAGLRRPQNQTIFMCHDDE